jgi:hypothetical protein
MKRIFPARYFQYFQIFKLKSEMVRTHQSDTRQVVLNVATAYGVIGGCRTLGREA